MILEPTIEKLLKCGGIILINSKGELSVVKMVRNTPCYSFPKGKREPDETIFETATRETFEETGITKDLYDLVPDLFYIEYLYKKAKAVPHTIYYVARMKEVIGENFEFKPKDSMEIESVGWFSIENILKNKLYTFQKQQKKKIILKVAHYIRRNFE